MVKLFKYSKKLVNTLILTSFTGMLCFSSIRADAAEGLQETINEEQNVRAASDIDDRNDNFINCRDSGTLCTLSGYMVSDDVSTTNTYVNLRDNRCPSLPATYAAASGSTDNSWLYRTMYLDDVYNAQTDIYLAQGNISKTSTISKSVAVDSTGNSYKANKLWLAYSTKSDEMGYNGNDVIPIPGMPSTSTAWYNSRLTTIKKFNAKGSGAANTPGIQRLRADGSVAIPTYFTPINEIPKGSLVYNDKSGDYLVNIRMPIYGLTPYVKITGLNQALNGYTLRKATPYYYTDDTKWISGYSGGTAASTDMYIASDMNSMILYAGATTSIAALNAEWSRHVYTFTFDCNDGQYNTNTLVKRWDMLANQKFPLNKKIAPTELSSNSGSVSRKGYDLDGWYTGAGGGTKIFNADGTACNAATSYWATVYNSETRENNYQLIKYENPLLDDITGVYSLSNVEATNNRVYTYDQNGNRTGVFPMYAHWNPYPYKVRYVFDNGDSPATGDAPVIENWIYDKDGQHLRSAPTRKGYTFSGWKISNGTDGDYADGTVFSASQEVKNLTARKNRTVTLTAQWTPNPYKITFHANYPNGTDDTSAQWTVVYDSNGYINSTAPKYSYDNYHIVGYKYANSDTRLYDWNGDVPNPTLYKTAANTWWDAYGQYKNACDIDVYAIWERDTFTLKYDSNGGSAVGNEIIYSGLDHLLPAGPTRDGYTFVGWAKQGEKDFYGNAVDQSLRSGYYKNESSTNPLNNGRANGNNSKYYFKTVTANCPGETTFNLQKPGGEITFVAIWAHYHNEANMDNLSNAGNNGQVYSHTTHGNNSFYVNTSNQNIFNISAGNTWLKTSPWYTLTDIRLLNSSGNKAPNSQTYNSTAFTSTDLSNSFSAADAGNTSAHGNRDIHKKKQTLNKQFSFNLLGDTYEILHTNLRSSCHWCDNYNTTACNSSLEATSNRNNDIYVIGDSTKPSHNNSAWTYLVNLKNVDVSTKSEIKITFEATDHCGDILGSGLDYNNTWIKIINKDNGQTKILGKTPSNATNNANENRYSTIKFDEINLLDGSSLFRGKLVFEYHFQDNVGNVSEGSTEVDITLPIIPFDPDPNDPQGMVRI